MCIEIWKHQLLSEYKFGLFLRLMISHLKWPMQKIMQEMWIAWIHRLVHLPWEAHCKHHISPNPFYHKKDNKCELDMLNFTCDGENGSDLIGVPLGVVGSSMIVSLRKLLLLRLLKLLKPEESWPWREEERWLVSWLKNQILHVLLTLFKMNKQLLKLKLTFWWMNLLLTHLSNVI